MNSDKIIVVDGKRYTAERFNGKSWIVRRLKGDRYDETTVALFTTDPVVAIKLAIHEGNWK